MDGSIEPHSTYSGFHYMLRSCPVRLYTGLQLMRARGSEATACIYFRISYAVKTCCLVHLACMRTATRIETYISSRACLTHFLKYRIEIFTIHIINKMRFPSLDAFCFFEESCLRARTAGHVIVFRKDNVIILCFYRGMCPSGSVKDSKKLKNPRR